VPSTVGALGNAASFAITTCKPAVAQKQVVVPGNVALLEIPICKPPVGLVHNNAVVRQEVAPRDSVGLFRTLTDRLTVGLRQVVAKASAALSATMTFRQCVEQRQAAAAVNAALSATLTCKRLAVLKQDKNIRLNRKQKNETPKITTLEQHRTKMFSNKNGVIYLDSDDL
jgi:hypothetical protein